MSITYAKGYRASALNCGIKKTALDLGLIESKDYAVAAGVFTKNVCCAAPVLLSKAHINSERIKAILVNSGNANAATGHQGYSAAKTTVEDLALKLDCLPTEILVASTGIIGVPLPVDKMISSFDMLVANLSKDNGKKVAQAILTTDTFQKEESCDVELSNGNVRIGGIAKGSGMIMPNMATMLAFLTTDVNIERHTLKEILKKAVDKSFNKITVDSDTSTNDCVFILANGAAGVQLNEAEKWKFYEAVESVCIKLAQKIIRDGEGATKFVTIIVEGCASEKDADTIARSIANSPLVKTALYGCNPNWGRIIAAAGKSGINFNQENLNVYFNNLLAVKNGVNNNIKKEKLQNEFNKKEIEIKININSGNANATIWTTDLSHKYIDINVDYS